MYERQYANLYARRRDWQTEEEVRLGWLTELQNTLGIVFHAERGRSDADYNQIVIEFKNVGLFHANENSPKFREALEELSRYIPAKASEAGLAIQDYLGIMIDGESIALAYYPDAASQIVHGPLMPISQASVQIVFDACNHSRRRALTATNLIEDFGHGSTTGHQLMQAMCDALVCYLQKEGNNKVKMLYEEWKALYGQVADLSSFQVETILESIGFVYTGETGEQLSRILFVIHSFDSIVIKILAAEIVSHFSHLASYSDFAQNTACASNEELIDILDRDIEHAHLYSRMNIHGFVEEPLFSWYVDVCREESNTEYVQRLQSAIRDVLIKLSLYEFEDLSHAQTNDVLKRFYQNIVPQVLRKSLGEFYTPDWLCNVALDKVIGRFDELRFLDPTCGSASFLLAIIKRIRETSELSPAELLNSIIHNVWGFDLNPLAVQTARVNYLIAISDLIMEVPGAELEIPILLADAIYSPAPDPEGDANNVNYSIGSSIAELTITLPTTLAQDRERLDRVFTEMETCIESDQASDHMLERLKNFNIISEQESIAWETVLSQTYNRVLSLHRRRWNGIWFRIVRNYFWSATAGDFDVIIGNPPWVRWSKLPELYRERVSPTCRKYDIFSNTPFYGGNELDISGLITYTVADKWLKNEGQLVFLLTQTHFQSASSEGFRRFCIHDNIRLSPVDVEDLKALKPFPDAANKTTIFNSRKTINAPCFPINYYIWDSAPGTVKMIPENATIDEVLSRRTRTLYEANPVQGGSSPWALLPPGRFETCEKLIGRCSWVEGRKGITCDLNGIYFVNVVNVSYDNNLVQIENRPEAGRTNIGPKKRFWIEPDCLYPVVKGASDIDKCSFNPRHELYALVPNQGINTESLQSSRELIENNLPRTYTYLREFETLLKNRSTYKTRMHTAPFYAIYNVGSYTFAPWKVVWPEQPGNKGVPAAVVHTKSSEFIGEKTIVPDHKIYFAEFFEREKAEYLCGLLTSSIVQEYLLSFNIMIQVGDIFQHMRLPEYNPLDQNHLLLIQLVREAETLLSANRKSELIERISLLGDQIISDWNPSNV